MAQYQRHDKLSRLVRFVCGIDQFLWYRVTAIDRGCQCDVAQLSHRGDDAGSKRQARRFGGRRRRGFFGLRYRRTCNLRQLRRTETGFDGTNAVENGWMRREYGASTGKTTCDKHMAYFFATRVRKGAA